MTTVTSAPEKDIRRGKKRGSDPAKGSRQASEDMKLELTCEGCTRGHLLKGGHRDGRRWVLEGS